MESFFKNALVWVVIGITLLNVGCYVGFRILVEKTANRVVEKLQKNYSPSPYGPGFDPDKLNADAAVKEVMFYESQGANMVDRVSDAEAWRVSWESSNLNP